MQKWSHPPFAREQDVPGKDASVAGGRAHRRASTRSGIAKAEHAAAADQHGAARVAGATAAGIGKTDAGSLALSGGALRPWAG